MQGTFPYTTSSTCGCIWHAYAVIPCVSSTSLRESNGCVIRLWTICVVSAQHRFRHVLWIALSADPKALSANCLMKFTSWKAGVFSNQRERVLQRRKKKLLYQCWLCCSWASVQTIIDSTHIWSLLLITSVQGFVEHCWFITGAGKSPRMMEAALLSGNISAAEPYSLNDLWLCILVSESWGGKSVCMNPTDV